MFSDSSKRRRPLIPRKKKSIVGLVTIVSTRHFSEWRTKKVEYWMRFHLVWSTNVKIEDLREEFEKMRCLCIGPVDNNSRQP